MSKFKDFQVRTTSDAMNKACFEHAYNLGYKLSDNDYILLDYLYFYSDGVFHSASGEAHNKLTVHEFFKLTPEDVRVEPETARFELSVKLSEPSWLEYKCLSAEINQEQYENIKAIMDEDND